MFIDTVGGLSSTEKLAINTLVLNLKSNGIWSGLTAFYPFVGTTASQQKYNLIDPQDTNAAFRLTFYGGWTHSSSGLIGNGTDTWADTNWASSLSVVTESPNNKGFKAFGAHILSPMTTNNPVMTNNNVFDFSNNIFMIGGSSNSLSVRISPPCFTSGVNNEATVSSFTGGSMQHIASYKTDGTVQGQVTFEWSTNGGLTRNTTGPQTATPPSNCASYYAPIGNILIGRFLNQALYTSLTFNCFYIAGGANALTAFGGGFTAMTTITTICKQFATDLGR